MGDRVSQSPGTQIQQELLPQVGTGIAHVAGRVVTGCHRDAPLQAVKNSAVGDGDPTSGRAKVVVLQELDDSLDCAPVFKSTLELLSGPVLQRAYKDEALFERQGAK